MSLKIIKAGVFDTIQDKGRFGYQHLGMNPSGTMDFFSAQLANALLGKEANAPVVELHFPASTILFEKGALMCLAGADFTPMVGSMELPIHQPVFLPARSVLQFKAVKWGSRAYLAILEDLELDPWLSSFSTNIKATAGGYEGRVLKVGDRLTFKKNTSLLPRKGSVEILHWKSYGVKQLFNLPLYFLKGNEWNWLTDDAKSYLEGEMFQIALEADRMGYQLKGPVLETKVSNQMISSAVNFGTIQLLPSGQLIILMADHQTTGGYPRVGHVILAHLPILAQRKSGDLIYFKATDLITAEEKATSMGTFLSDIKANAKINMEKWIG